MWPATSPLFFLDISPRVPHTTTLCTPTSARSAPLSLNSYVGFVGVGLHPRSGEGRFMVGDLDVRGPFHPLLQLVVESYALHSLLN